MASIKGNCIRTSILLSIIISLVVLGCGTESYKPALMEIRTIITMTEDEDENIISHIEKVSALSEENVFAIPDNINFYSTEPYGTVIRYPISENDWYDR